MAAVASAADTITSSDAATGIQALVPMATEAAQAAMPRRHGVAPRLQHLLPVNISYLCRQPAVQAVQAVAVAAAAVRELMVHTAAAVVQMDFGMAAQVAQAAQVVLVAQAVMEEAVLLLYMLIMQ